MTLLVKIYFELTLIWVNFFQGITAPVCCTANEHNVTLCAVEQKNWELHTACCVCKCKQIHRIENYPTRVTGTCTY
jgi:hypothetical protein